MSSGRGAERVVHQDYIVRIRYSNQLPPPPNPPKLLEIPGTGLADGQYTSAAYAARLAREQPVNIEADAELGMPIDLIGIPGIFDNNDSAIMARPHPGPLHPADRALLKPISAFNKSATSQAGVSFLRRTEYISSQGPQLFSSSTSKDLLRLRDKKQPKANLSKEDPLNIIRNIAKGFDIAYPQDAYTGEDTPEQARSAPVTDQDTQAWLRPKHPTRPELELLDSYPVLPDLDAIPDSGFYVVHKFITNPVAASDSYDGRLDAAILRPRLNTEAQARYEQKRNDWNEKSGKPQPIPEYDFDYYLPEEGTVIRNVKRKFNPNDPDNENSELYSHDIDEERRAFKFPRIRTYETYNQHGDLDNLYNDSIGLALHDPETEVGAVPGMKQRLSKAAYFYPIVQRTALRPKRKVGALALAQQAEGETVDELYVQVVDPSEELRSKMLEKQGDLDPSLASEGAAIDPIA